MPVLAVVDCAGRTSAEDDRDVGHAVAPRRLRRRRRLCDVIVIASPETVSVLTDWTTVLVNVAVVLAAPTAVAAGMLSTSTWACVAAALMATDTATLPVAPRLAWSICRLSMR